MISYSLIAKFAGGSPAASHFLLLRQEKVTQEKGRPGLGAAQRGAGRGAAAAFNNREPERRRLLPRTGLRQTNRSRPLARRSFGLPCAARQAGRLPPKVTSFGARNSPLPLRGKDSDSPRRAPRTRCRVAAVRAGVGEGCVQQSRAGAPMSAPANGACGERVAATPRLGCAARRLTREAGWWRRSF